MRLLSLFSVPHRVTFSLSELYGLLLFLGVHVYCVRFWWTHLLYEPYCRGSRHDLENVMSKVMWRTAKKDVLDQVRTALIWTVNCFGYVNGNMF